MTLPPYHTTPLPTERLIAREGERGGVDTVVEYPESELQAESRREEEMQALYNVRQARRREQSDREERRRLRREARAAGNWTRVEELERQSQARATERRNNEQSMLQQLQAAEERGEIEGLPAPDSAYLIAELNSLRERNSRSRRVSSVSYADLGLARHDGSRIRAGSFESDNHPLLDSAASIGQRSRATSRASSAGRRPSINDLVEPSRPMTGHTRNGSYGGASYLSDDEDNTVRSPRIALLTPQTSEDQPPPHPPSYEDDISVHGGEAPPYESPVRERNPVFGREDTSIVRENSDATRRADEELRDEINVAERFLERPDDSSSSSPTADTPSDSTGDYNTNPPPNTEGGLQSQHSAVRTKPPILSAPVRSHPPNIHTKPRMPPQIEVSNPTPVNSAPNSPIESRGRNDVR
ncbi:MAG: hypothetical protein MMC23_000927 [Stictis urceolatum]|nr:hypothetical protein [Stictis urceolata]